MSSLFTRVPWFALGFASIVLLPFLGKAYTMDDPVFLREAQQLLRDPLHPSAIEIVWHNEHRLRASAFLPGGPAIAYLLLPLALADWTEWAGHLLMLVYFGATIAGTAALARELGLSPWAQQAAALLAASAPVALGMAGTLMPDIPAAMFSVWGVERYIVWMRTRDWRVGLAAACLLALAVLTRMNLLVLVGIVGLWGLRRSWRSALPAALAVALCVTGFLLTQDPHPNGGTPASAAQWQLRLDRSGFHAVSLGTAYLLTTPVLAALLTRRRLAAHTGLLWLWLLIPFPTIIYFHFAPKYLLPALPAVAILAAHGLQGLTQRLAVLVVLVGAGTILGIAILRADARMAGAARLAAEQIIRPLAEAGEPVWYAGHSGFHWYAEGAGAKPVAIEPPYPAPGDILVASTVDEPGILCFLPRVLLEEHGDTMPAGRIMSRRVSAGFYSNIFGLWPWGWASPDTTPFQVWRINGPPQHTIDPALRPSWCGPQQQAPIR